MISKIHLRFYEELNDLLPPDKRKCLFPFIFEGNMPVKAVLCEFKVPLELVELILVNGKSVGFSYPLINGDRVSVYPVIESLDVGSVIRVRERPLRQIRFLVDPGLSRLASYLRLLGFDTLVPDSVAGKETIPPAELSGRIRLTRDATLLHDPSITRIHFVRKNKTRLQLEEILSRYDLYGMVSPFSRCPSCNKTVQGCRDWHCSECGQNKPNNLRAHRLQLLVRRIIGH